jgi:hypothetical protein
VAATGLECSVFRWTVLGTYPGLTNPRDVAVAESRVYVTESGGLRVIGTSDPASPVETGFLAASEGYRQIVVGAGKAIAATDSSVKWRASGRLRPRDFTLLGAGGNQQTRVRLFVGRPPDGAVSQRVLGRDDYWRRIAGR